MAKYTQPARLKPDGTILTGSCAEMESGGRLNPAHSLWLMGYPPQWMALAPSDCGCDAELDSNRFGDDMLTLEFAGLAIQIYGVPSEDGTTGLLARAVPITNSN